MPSPFTISPHKPGSGTVHLTLLPPSTPSFSTLNFTYPLKLLPSSPHILAPNGTSQTSAESKEDSSTTSKPLTPKRPSAVPLLFLLTYGGGLLSNDHIHLSLTLDAFSRLTIATQGSTKIFKVPTPSEPTPESTKPISSQTLDCTLHPHSALFYSPHPTQPFASSRYSQVQIFDLHDGASLGLLDWVSEGRRARGESWEFEGWRGRNEVWTITRSKEEDTEKRRLLLRDSVILEGREIKKRMEGLGIFGTLILVGPILQSLAVFFTSEFAALPRIGGRNWDTPTVAPTLTPREKWRVERQAKEKIDEVTWTAARVRSDRAVVVKFGARDVQGAREWLGAMLREEGSVAREFGEGALMGVG
ncbi:hypothetical protein G7Y79_00027g060800 [Physcia stellaris]|nr:hypothetical protein G7Y79_00027g060800 [Physcia stellaris]